MTAEGIDAVAAALGMVAEPVSGAPADTGQAEIARALAGKRTAARG